MSKRKGARSYKNEEDLLLRFHKPKDLLEREGQYEFEGKVVVTADIADALIEEYYEDKPEGRSGLYRRLCDDFYGITQKQVTAFIDTLRQGRAKRDA